MTGLNVLGVIEEVHGQKGAVRVRPAVGDAGELENRSILFIADKDNKMVRYEGFEVKRYRGNTYLVKFKGFKWRDEVRALVNCVVAA